jgi:methyl-accepting chemotaxis protein
VKIGAQGIVQNVSESSQGLSEIATTVNGVSTAVIDTASGISQIKTSTEQLAELSKGLKKLVSQFRI